MKIILKVFFLFLLFSSCGDNDTKKKLIFNIPTQNNIYPCVVSLKDGRIVSHSFQSPGTTALYDLEKQL